MKNEGMAVIVQQNGQWVTVGYTSSDRETVRRDVRRMAGVTGTPVPLSQRNGATGLLCDSEELAQRIFERHGRYEEPTAPKAAATTRSWRDDPATQRQIACLVALGVELEPHMTKGRASDLISAARSGEGVGSIGGFFTDGSN